MAMVRQAEIIKDNSKLRARVDRRDRENAELRAHLAEFKHQKEHQNAEIVLVDNSKNAVFDTSDSTLTVNKFTVKLVKQSWLAGVEIGAIRSMHGFSTVPLKIGTSGSLNHYIHYFEVSIDEPPIYPWIHVGLVAKDHPMNCAVGCSEQAFGIGIRQDGKVWQLGKEITAFGGGWFKNDVIGCGIKVTQRTENAVAVNCEECTQKQYVVFFTKNGQLMGTPIPLPSDVPCMLHPCVSLQNAGDKVTANFGHQPFKYAIPPAKGLKDCGHCCHCKRFVV